MATGVSKSLYLSNKLLDHVLRVASFTMPAALYVALYTADPGEGSSAGVPGGTEVGTVNTNYARQTLTFGTSSGGSNANTNTVSFASVGSAGYGTVTYMAIMDAVTGGAMLYHGPLTTPRTYVAGDAPSFAIGAITLLED